MSTYAASNEQAKGAVDYLAMCLSNNPHLLSRATALNESALMDTRKQRRFKIEPSERERRVVEIKAAIASGLVSIADIAGRANIPETTVKRLMRKHGIKPL